MIMKKNLFCVVALGLLTNLPAAKGGEPARYQELNHHDFLRRWLILSPLPVLPEHSRPVS